MCGVYLENGEGGIRTHSIGEAKRNLPRQLLTSNKQGLFQDPLSFPQVSDDSELYYLA